MVFRVNPIQAHIDTESRPENSQNCLQLTLAEKQWSIENSRCDVGIFGCHAGIGSSCGCC